MNLLSHEQISNKNNLYLNHHGNTSLVIVLQMRPMLPKTGLLGFFSKICVYRFADSDNIKPAGSYESCLRGIFQSWETSIVFNRWQNTQQKIQYAVWLCILPKCKC